ncbi:metallophosphoesterase family protein [Aporhodopirellula aestuarii]|uniref:Metallophosphoesterase TT1561-like domain-containing protein n=1 Tax=Aporhodopirellula aestuarii TaxID=2950107 RepID=A0ABT0UBA9_9BACT|nr:hypothetical protein [Aporhodopirellula aestuarii]MCM2373673.1 hypothetical protein [Aporhodopirellula aestuarii]
MKRLLVCGRFDGDPHSLEHLQTFTQRHQPDAILIAGLWHGSNGYDRKMPAEQKLFYRELFETVKRTDRIAIILPGEHDVPMADFMRLILMEERNNAKLHCVHATHHVEQNVLFAGLGGDLNEVIDTWNDRLRCSRSSADYFLRDVANARVPYTVLMLTTPILGSIGDGLHSDIAGDTQLASEIINSTHPVLAVVAGETSNRNCKRLGTSRVINPGRISEGSATIVDLTDLDRVEFITNEETQLVS